MEGTHGHVIPRPDGAKARCGGPALCATCAKEKASEEFKAYLREVVGYKIGDHVYAPEDVLIIRRQDHGGEIEATT